MSKPHHRTGRGPVRADQLRAGDRYEVSQGHPYYCAPTGGDGARGVIAGALVLDSDPAVDSTGVDAGYQISEDTMRAPDIAVGGVPDAPGWVKGGAPPLAVEYAGSGQESEVLGARSAAQRGARRGPVRAWRRAPGGVAQSASAERIRRPGRGQGRGARGRPGGGVSAPRGVGASTGRRPVPGALGLRPRMGGTLARIRYWARPGNGT